VVASAASKAVGVVGAGQFLPVARDQQQRVIRARTEDQDAGDSGGGAVERQARELRHGGAHRRGQAIGERDHRQRNQPQKRRAVRDDQQYRDNRRSHCQQGDVGCGERVRDIGGEGRPAGHLHHKVIWRSGRYGVAQRCDGVV